MKLQRKSTEPKVIVKVIDGPETVDQCINDLEIVYDKGGIPEGLRLKLY